MSKSPNLVIVVAGIPRNLTIKEKAAIRAAMPSGKVQVVNWPSPEPVYSSGKRATALRAQYRQDAYTACAEVHDAAANAIGDGNSVTVIVGAGAIVNAVVDETSGDVVTYANVHAAGQLKDIADNAAAVHVLAGSEDPRTYVPRERPAKA